MTNRTEQDIVRTEQDIVRTEQDVVRTKEDIVRTEQEVVRTVPNKTLFEPNKTLFEPYQPRRCSNQTEQEVGPTELNNRAPDDGTRQNHSNICGSESNKLSDPVRHQFWFT